MAKEMKAAITSLKEPNDFFSDILSSEFTNPEKTAKSTGKNQLNQTDSEKNRINEQLQMPDNIIRIDPALATNWYFHDRPENELGDLHALAEDMNKNGQVEPCIARPIQNNKKHQYEIIVGERRWRAALLRNIKLKIIVRNISDEKAAIIQAAENCNRVDLSDYAIGISYAKLLEKDVLRQKDLQEHFNKSQVEITRLLSFSKVPQEIWNAVKDMSLISARTSATIRSLANKGQKYVDAIIQLAPRIRTGKLGANKLQKEVEHLLMPITQKPIVAVKGQNGDILFKYDPHDSSTLLFKLEPTLRKAHDLTKIKEKLAHHLLQILNNAESNK